MSNLDECLEDMKALHSLMKDKYAYQINMARPPHYVDKIEGGFTSYDLYDLMGYQYMVASYDGAGWLPMGSGSQEDCLKAEVDATVEPMRSALEKNPDFFSGQIVFQKDDYNMAKRTPIAFRLKKQLEILKEYGYRVVTVNQLLEISPFTDLGRDDDDFEKLNFLQKNHAIVFSDNNLRLNQNMTYGELAMLLAPKHEAINRRIKMIKNAGKSQNRYVGVTEWCKENELIKKDARLNDEIKSLPAEFFESVKNISRREVYRSFKI